MKKLFTLLALVWCAATGGWAAKIGDVTPISSDYTLIADNVTSKGTVAIGKSVLFGDNHFLSDSQGLSVATNKGSSTIGGVSYLNSLRVKNNVMIAFKVSGKCKVKVYHQSNSSRTIIISSKYELSKGDVVGEYSTTTTEATITGEQEVYVYSIDSSNLTTSGKGDLYIAGIEVTFESTEPAINFASPTATAYLGQEFVSPKATLKNCGSATATYSSSNTNVATVSTDGNVTVKAKGETTITAKVTVGSTELSASYTLTVKDVAAIAFAKDVEGVYNVNRMFPAASTVDKGTNFTLPLNYFYYKEGYTLTGYSDGANTYAPGAAMPVTGDVTLTPVFQENEVSLDSRGTDTEITIDLKRGTNGNRYINIEGNADKLIFPATINGKTIDFAVDVNCNEGAAIEGSKGKLNNTSDEVRAQMNKGTLITVPAAKNMVVKVYYTNGTPTVSAMTFAGSDADEVNTSDKYIQYTYTGTAETLDLVDQGSSIYPSKIVLLYPTAPTKTKTPVITAGAFDFVKKGTPVTITAEAGATVQYSTDGGSTWQNYTEAIILKSAATVQAKASVEGLEDSEVAELTAGENVNASLPFVAVVYQKDYNDDTKNAVALKTLYAAMLGGYNTILVGAPDNSVAWETLCPTLDKADLVIITEAMSGGKTFSNSLKSIAEKAVAGEAKVINLKAFNYTSGRWSWGTPTNAEKDVVTVTPANKNYKLFNNCNYNADGTLTLFTTSGLFFNGEANHIQYVNLNADIQEQSTVFAYTAAPANVVIHSIGDNYLFLGLSCDNFAATLPARTLVGNAVRMLIAGDKLDAINPIELPISSVGYATFCPEVDVTIPADVEAYIVTALPENDYVKLTPITGNIAKGEGVIVKGTAGAKVSFEGATAAATKSADNILVGTLATKDLADAEAYILVAQEGEAKFSLCSAGTIAAGKAYLPASGSAAPTLKFVFDDATFIQSVTEANGYELKANGAYNLAGQKVSTGYKGIVIKNGVKMIKK